MVADPAGGAGDLLMFYEAQSKERQHSIGLATSADGPPSGGSNLKPAGQRFGCSNSRVRAVRPCNRSSHFMFVTLDTTQPEMSCLNSEAPLNIFLRDEISRTRHTII